MTTNDDQRKISFISSFYSQIDEKVNYFENCCQKGCSYCCHQSIEVFSMERVLIGKYIKDSISRALFSKIKSNLNNWLDYFDKQTKNKTELAMNNDYPAFREQIVKDKIPCPFLVDNLCSIYPVRPMTCRTHFVQNSPQLCAKDGLRNPCKISTNIRDASVLYMTTHTTSEIYLLPITVIEFFEEN